MTDGAADDESFLMVCPVHERFVPCRPCARAEREGRADNHADLWTSDPEAVAKVKARHEP